MIHLKKIIIVCSMAITLWAFIKCTGNNQSDTTDPRGSQYAGSSACISCHKDIFDSYIHSGHFKTSAKAGYGYLKDTIHALLNDTVNFINNQQVILSGKDSDLYQTYYRDHQLYNSQKMDIAFGSAEKAQTYAYWKDSELYELPLTYLTNEKIWTNSPGFPADHPYFTRVIPSRCLECHTSYVQAHQEANGSVFQIKEVYNPSSIIYGIDCERCHGPAEQHVEFQRANPDIKQAKFITSIKSLTRVQQTDMCGTCHSGDPIKLKSIFGFVPGDTLKKFYLFYSAPSSGEPDVHGMQLQLLQMSKCFQLSKITCTTCHSPHQSQESIQNFVNTCIACHQEVKHTMDIKIEKSNCITCHMPLRSSKSLDFNNQTDSHNIQYMLRTHDIAIYPKKEWK